MNVQPVFATVATEVASLTRISDFLTTLRTEIAAARTLEQAGANQRYRWFLEDVQEDLRNLSRELNSPDSRTSSGGGGTPRGDGSIDGYGNSGSEHELEPHEAEDMLSLSFSSEPVSVDNDDPDTLPSRSTEESPREAPRRQRQRGDGAAAAAASADNMDMDGG